MAFHIAFAGIDMNDPASLLVYTGLVRFQVEVARPEARFSYPGNETQRMLQSFAHGLGLEYEYSLDSREARITRALVSGSTDAGTPAFGSVPSEAERQGCENIFGDTTNILANDTPVKRSVSMHGQADPLTSSFEFGSLDFNVDGLSDAIPNADWGLVDVHSRIQEPDLEVSLEATNVLPVTPGGTDFLASSDIFPEFQAQGAIDQNPLLPQSQMSDEIDNSDFSWHGSYNEHSFSSEMQNDQLSFPAFSMALSSIIRDEELTSNFSDASIFSSRKAGSRSSSISSIQSGSTRGRISKIPSRKPSVHRQDNLPGFQEITFNSRPPRPSTSSRRQGPLNAIALAAMNAVTAAGACWRCKFLRKSCDTEDPCKACPKPSSQSPWRAVGCKRGTIKTVMLPIPLCQQANSGTSANPTSRETAKSEVLCARANGFSYQAIKRRPEHTPSNASSSHHSHSGLDTFLEGLVGRWPVLESCFDKRISSLDHKSQEMLIPLDECILAIIWEAFDCPLSKNIIGNIGDTLILMRAAALYQAKYNNDKLISQSLICLRSALEALRLKYSGFLDIVSHRTCDAAACKVNCIAQLSSALSKYLAALSCIFFKKENMRSKSWRLSIFYSLCIQSVVRRALVSLVSNKGSINACLGAKKYLHLGVRLFIASSGTYDPLFSAGSKALVDGDVPRVDDYILARCALRLETLAPVRITSSADYLKYVFEDDGKDVDSELDAGDESLDDQDDAESATSEYKNSALERIINIKV